MQEQHNSTDAYIIKQLTKGRRQESIVSAMAGETHKEKMARKKKQRDEAYLFSQTVKNAVNEYFAKPEVAEKLPTCPRKLFNLKSAYFLIAANRKPSWVKRILNMTNAEMKEAYELSNAAK